MDLSGFSGHRPGSSLVSSRRDLDASKRSRDVANPKKRMLGLTPIIVFKGPTPEKRKSGSLTDGIHGMPS